MANPKNLETGFIKDNQCWDGFCITLAGFRLLGFQLFGASSVNPDKTLTLQVPTI